MDIRFGTDGWRGIDGEDVNPDSVSLVATAIARYMVQAGTDDRGLIVGYDCRKRSEEYARLVAEVAVGHGINVWLSAGHVPTPVAAFAVKHLNAGGAVMITASHNPAQYNGLKFIPDYAGPATSDITSTVETLIREKADMSVIAHGRITTYNVLEPYLEHVCRRLGPFTCEGCSVVVDPLYGASRGFVDQALMKTGCNLITIHNTNDQDFGGYCPDPTAHNMTELINVVQTHGADMGIALDGDGDRIAACDRQGTVYTANQLLPLIYRYLLDERQELGGVARTVATTHLLDRLAQARDQFVVETPVGFKYVGPLLNRGDIVLAGEESGGISIRGHVPDKDAMIGAVLLTSLVAHAETDLRECWYDLTEEMGMVSSIRVDVPVDASCRGAACEGFEGLTAEMVSQKLGRKVQSINRSDGLKVEYQDGSWWLARPSGTEPVIRFYAEAVDESKARELIAEAEGLLG